LGTGNDIARLDAADATFRLWIGNATASSAPFSVRKNGYLHSNYGSIGGWTIGASTLTGTNMSLNSSTGYIEYGSLYLYFLGDDIIFGPGATGHVVSHGGFFSTTESIFQANIEARSTLDVAGPITKYGAGNLAINENVDISGTLDVGTDLTMTGGNITATTTAASLGATTVNGLLSVTGAIDVRGNIRDDGGTLTLGDDVAITNTLDARGNIYNSLGNVTVDDAMLVTGNLSTQGSLEIDGALNHDGSTVGFYNTTPATKQTVTGSRGGNAALASLLTALSTIGLITDSSS
jgi:hypothetical protein